MICLIFDVDFYIIMHISIDILYITVGIDIDIDIDVDAKIYANIGINICIVADVGICCATIPICLTDSF